MPVVDVAVVSAMFNLHLGTSVVDCQATDLAHDLVEGCNGEVCLV